MTVKANTGAPDGGESSDDGLALQLGRMILSAQRTADAIVEEARRTASEIEAGAREPAMAVGEPSSPNADSGGRPGRITTDVDADAVILALADIEERLRRSQANLATALGQLDQHDPPALRSPRQDSVDGDVEVDSGVSEAEPEAFASPALEIDAPPPEVTQPALQMPPVAEVRWAPPTGGPVIPLPAPETAEPADEVGQGPAVSYEAPHASAEPGQTSNRSVWLPNLLAALIVVALLAGVLALINL